MTDKFNQEKQAALSMLVEQGVDFEKAAELVEKKARELTGEEVVNTPGLDKRLLGATVGGHLGHEASKLVNAKGKFGRVVGAIAGGSTGLLAGQKVHNAYRKSLHEGDSLGKIDDRNQKRLEKKAAFDMLIDAGVDFEKAAELVEAKAKELYNND